MLTNQNPVWHTCAPHRWGEQTQFLWQTVSLASRRLSSCWKSKIVGGEYIFILSYWTPPICLCIVIVHVTWGCFALILVQTILSLYTIIQPINKGAGQRGKIRRPLPTYFIFIADPYPHIFILDFPSSPASGGQKVEVEYVQTFIAVS